MSLADHCLRGGPGRAVLARLDPHLIVVAPCDEARKLAEWLYNQRDRLSGRYRMADLNISSSWREVHHVTIKVARWSLQLSAPEGSLARISPALWHVSMGGFGFHQ